MNVRPALPRWRVTHLFLMTALYFCSAGFQFQFPRDVLRMGGTAQQAGLLVSLGLIPALLLARSIGEWNRLSGGRWPALLGGLVVILSNVLMLTADHVGGWMVSLRLLFGVGHMLMSITLFAQAAFLVEDPVQRATIIGWQAVMTQLGNAIGGTIGEHAYHYGAAAFWLGSCGFALLAAILAACWTVKPKAALVVSPNDVPVKFGWPPEVWGIVAIAMAFSGVTQFIPPFVDHLSSTGEIIPFAASWFVTSALLMIALVRLVGSYYASRLLHPAVLKICHGVLLLALLAVPWLHTKYEAVFLGLAFGMAYGWLYPALNALAFNRLPAEARGKVAGWMVTAYEIGFRLSPIGFGTLISYSGYRAMFFGLVMTYCMILLVSWKADKRYLVAAGA
jgi:MFS family permease